MKGNYNQKKLINIFFIVAVILLIINLITEKFLPENYSFIPRELTSAEIDSSFKSALFNLGIQKEWIKDQSKNEELKFAVSIPKGFPVIILLSEMNDVFDTNLVKIYSVEKKIGGNTTVSIESGGEQMLKAEFVYSDKIKRKNIRVGFLLRSSGVDNSDSLLLEYPEQFAFLLVPSKSSAEFAKKVINSGKEYILHLNDEITDLDFKLSDKYSETRLKSSIREIVGTYPNAVFFLIDNKSSLYDSNVFPLLKVELQKRKIRLIEQDNFVDLSSVEKGGFIFNFNDSLNTLNEGEDKIYIISSVDFYSLNPEVIKYRKLGYRFTNPSALL